MARSVLIKAGPTAPLRVPSVTRKKNDSRLSPDGKSPSSLHVFVADTAGDCGRDKLLSEDDTAAVTLQSQTDDPVAESPITVLFLYFLSPLPRRDMDRRSIRRPTDGLDSDKLD